MHMTKLPTLLGHLQVPGYFTGVKECTVHHLKLLMKMLLNVKPLVSKLQSHNDVNSDSEGGSETLHFLSPHRSQQLLIVNCCGLVTPVDPHPARLRHPPNPQTSQLQGQRNKVISLRFCPFRFLWNQQPVTQGLPLTAMMLPQWNFGSYLGGGDDDSAVDVGGTEVLHDGQVLIWRSWGRVHYQVIHFTPVHIPQELLDQP